MTTSQKVLIIGLDGVTWNVLSPWIEEGVLPNLGRFQKEGSWGQLMSTVPPLTAPAWTSFATGKNPGKHGIFHFVAMDDIGADDSAKLNIVNSRTVKSPTLWDILGHHQRQVGLINIPITYPPRPVNGFMITGMLTPPTEKIFTHPPELSSQITDYQIDLDRFINKKPFAEQGQHSRIEPTPELMAEFKEMMIKRAKTTLRRMAEHKWDMMMPVFTGPDRIGHYFWFYHLASDSDGSAEWAKLHAAVKDYYITLDDYVGQIMAAAGPNAVTLIMSDHGMGRNYHRSVNWNNWLKERSLLSIQDDFRSPDSWLLKLGISRDRISKIVRKIPGLVDSPLIKKVKKASPLAFNPAETVAYYRHIYASVGGFHINLSGEEKEKLITLLMTELPKVRDPETDAPVVKTVYRGEDCFYGPYAANVPDVVIAMHWQYSGNSALSQYSSLVRDVFSAVEEGQHHPEGVFGALGPMIAAQAKGLPQLNIQDIAPTVLYLMGLPVPNDMDGRPLTEIVPPEFLQTNPVQFGQPTEFWPSNQAAQEAQQAEANLNDEVVKDRLRALGYFE